MADCPAAHRDVGLGSPQSGARGLGSPQSRARCAPRQARAARYVRPRFAAAAPAAACGGAGAAGGRMRSAERPFIDVHKAPVAPFNPVGAAVLPGGQHLHQTPIYWPRPAPPATSNTHTHAGRAPCLGPEARTLAQVAAPRACARPACAPPPPISPILLAPAPHTARPPVHLHQHTPNRRRAPPARGALVLAPHRTGAMPSSTGPRHHTGRPRRPFCPATTTPPPIAQGLGAERARAPSPHPACGGSRPACAAPRRAPPRVRQNPPPPPLVGGRGFRPHNASALTSRERALAPAGPRTVFPRRAAPRRGAPAAPRTSGPPSLYCRRLHGLCFLKMRCAAPASSPQHTTANVASAAVARAVARRSRCPASPRQDGPL